MIKATGDKRTSLLHKKLRLKNFSSFLSSKFALRCGKLVRLSPLFVLAKLLSLGVSGIQTLDLKTMSQMFYHCAASALALLNISNNNASIS